MATKGGLDAATVSASPEIADALRQQIALRQQQMAPRRSDAFAAARAALGGGGGGATAARANTNAMDLIGMRAQLAQADVLTAQKQQLASLLSQSQMPDEMKAVLLNQAQLGDVGGALQGYQDIYKSFFSPTEGMKNIRATGLDPTTMEGRIGLLGPERVSAESDRRAALAQGLQGMREMAVEELRQKHNLTRDEAQSMLRSQEKQFEHTLETGSGMPGQQPFISKIAAQQQGQAWTKTFNDLSEATDKNTDAVRATNVIVDVLKNNPNVDFGMFQGTKAQVIGALASVGLATEGQQQFRTAYNTLDSARQQIVIPLAKALGVNPTNVDAERIEKSFAGPGATQDNILVNVLRVQAMQTTAKQKQKFLADAQEAGLSPQRAEVEWKTLSDQIYNQTLQQTAASLGIKPIGAR